jgi:hypothetical protein
MRTSFLGGESAHRGFFGGRVSRARVWSVGSALVIGLLLILINLVVPGILALLLGIPLAFVLTIDTANGTLVSRQLARYRYWHDHRAGLNVFVPYDQEQWELLAENAMAAKGRKAKRDAWREIRGMRAVPSGVEGMDWLRDTQRTAGIQWHREPGAEEYLAVTFATSGQVSGIESQSYFDASAAGFGALLGSLGSTLGLATRVQSTARVMPMDSTEHQAWVRDHIDEDVPRVLAQSYRQVISELQRGQLEQRNLITVSWPLTPQFLGKAKRRAEGQAGWIRLMDDEIRNLFARARAAGFQNLSVLTARQTAAMIRHMQHPGFAADKVADLSPMGGFLPSEDSWSFTTYAGASEGPDGGVTSSLSRTARIDAGDVETTERNSLWLAPLLTSMPTQVVRSIAFHQEIVPQEDARHFAESDIVTDTADSNERAGEGSLTDATIDVGKNAALRRWQDLKPGTGFHGSNWVGYITVTAGDTDGLIDACDAVEAGAAEAGITQLRWLDTQSAAANACTWPVGRGIRPAGRASHMKVRSLLTGSGAKEAL